jgi:ribosomal protein L13E
MYIHQQSDWMRDIDRDFENMHRQTDAMRARHERMMRDVWEAPIDPQTTMTSIVSNGDYQYSVNTRDGKLDGFVTMSDTTKAGLLLAQINGFGLTVDQKDSKLFLNRDAQKLNELLKVLGK